MVGFHHYSTMDLGSRYSSVHTTRKLPISYRCLCILNLSRHDVERLYSAFISQIISIFLPNFTPLLKPSLAFPYRVCWLDTGRPWLGWSIDIYLGTSDVFKAENGRQWHLVLHVHTLPMGWLVSLWSLFESTMGIHCALLTFSISLVLICWRVDALIDGAIAIESYFHFLALGSVRLSCPTSRCLFDADASYTSAKCVSYVLFKTVSRLIFADLIDPIVAS